MRIRKKYLTHIDYLTELLPILTHYLVDSSRQTQKASFKLKDRVCDCFYVANALEVIPNHNEFLQDLLRCLKPKGTGVFFVNPSELTTLDTELVEFIELTDWKTTVNPSALLSIETYRDLLVNNGFLITDEFEWLFNFFITTMPWIGGFATDLM